jgi:hypothetical protein
VSGAICAIRMIVSCMDVSLDGRKACPLRSESWQPA